MTAKKPEDRAPIGGNGKLRCHICDKPTRDHPIGRCPEWDGMHTTPVIERRNLAASRDAKRKREWRAANPGRN